MPRSPAVTLTAAGAGTMIPDRCPLSTSSSPARDRVPTAAAPLVRIVVLNWNGRDHLARCLDALCALDWPADRLDLVVVDNASTDGSDRLVEGYPRVRLVRNDHNGGFVANNLALRDLDGVDYVGLVNADSFVEPGWLTALVAGIEADDRLGAVSARMVFADRFVEVRITSPTFSPPGPDPRDLGVMVSGVRVDGVDRWRDAQVAEGAWGIEHRPDGSTFQWTRTTPRCAFPWATGPGCPTRVAIELSAEAAKSVTVRSGDAAATRRGRHRAGLAPRAGGRPAHRRRPERRAR